MGKVRFQINNQQRCSWNQPIPGTAPGILAMARSPRSPEALAHCWKGGSEKRSENKPKFQSRTLFTRHSQVPFVCRGHGMLEEPLGAPSRPVETLAEPLAGFWHPSHSEHCPCRQGGRMVRALALELGRSGLPPGSSSV